MTNNDGWADDSGSGVFSPKAHLSSYAVLLEVTAFKPNQRNPFAKEGSLENTHRDEIVADITVFQSAEHIEKDQGTYMPNTRIVHTYLVSDIQQFVGQKVVKRLVQPKQAYSWRRVEGADFEKVKAYVARRDAKLAAVADDSELGL